MNDHNEKVIKEALELRRAQEDAEFLKEIEEAKNNPDFKVTESEVKQLMKDVSKKKSYKPMFKVASVILVIAASLTVVTMSADGFSEKITAFFASLKHSEYATVDVGENDDLFSTYKGQFCPSIIPKGYEIKSVEYSSNKNVVIFENNNGNIILYKEQSGELKSNVDTEGADEIREIVINEMEGIYVKKGNVEDIVLKVQENMLYLTDNDAKVDLISFAELIEKK